MIRCAASAPVILTLRSSEVSDEYRCSVSLRLDTESGHRFKIVSVNIDENQETAGKYQVMSIPTMIVFKGGQPAKTIVGAMPKKRLEAEIEPALTA